MNMNGQTRWMGSKTEYPLWGILAVMGLVLISPFVSPYLCYFAFVISICRMLRFDAKVFAVDYAILIPVCQFYRTTGGMSLLVWLCLVAAIWFFVRGKIKVNSALVAIILLLNYLLLRMQMNISNFVLCFGQMLVLYVLLPQQDDVSAKRIVKAFCWSLVITSLYALLFRSTAQIAAIRGAESAAIWGTSIMRFSGLIQDPNYYITLLLVGMAALCKLKETANISTLLFVFLIVALSVFGVLSYSKTFFVVFILLGGVYVIWQFWNKKIYKGIFFSMCAIAGLLFIVLSKNSPFAIVLARLTSGGTVSDLTTRRSDLFLVYWKSITETIGVFIFGNGLDAALLQDKGTHNLILECIYYIGAIGLVLITALYSGIVTGIVRHNEKTKKQNIISKYTVLLIVMVEFLALHGLFEIITYACFFVAFVSIYIVKREQE